MIFLILIGEVMRTKNKLSLFWGMIVAENFDYSKQKSLIKLIKLALIIFAILMIVKEIIKAYVVS